MGATKIREVAARALLGAVLGAFLGGSLLLLSAIRPALQPGGGRLTRLSGAVGRGLYGENNQLPADEGRFPGAAGLVILAGGALFGLITGAAGGGARGGRIAGAIAGAVLGAVLFVQFLRIGEFGPVEQGLLALTIPAVAVIGWLIGMIVGSVLAAISPPRRGVDA